MKLHLPEQLKRTFFLFLFLATGIAFSQTKSQIDQITSRYNLSNLSVLEKQFENKNNLQKQKALSEAKSRNIPSKITLPDGGFAELQYIAEDGSPIYYRTFNVNAAISTRANFLNSGGGLGLSIDGQNMSAYVWDGGHARVTHQEYDGSGGNNRVTIVDAASEGGTQLNFHAAHVTGTITASGVQSNAKGMAPQSKVRGYMWNNDVAEATAAASNGMLLSNHSYGYRSDLVPDYYFGAYITESRDWDQLMYNAPYYLMVVAAGNDGNTNYNGSPLNGNSAYDKLTGHATSKNNMVVANANDANINGSGNLVSVSINSSSSEGPTDDLRIKPDITGNGTSVTSTYESSDSAYGTITGTSMASPNVTGTLLLLQQHYNNLNGSFMRASTLKGLALHTADDAGTTGPDAIYGWGLLNAKRAAEVITGEGTNSKIDELTLSPGQTYTITVDSDGINKLMASISWTDLPGVATTQTNSSTPRLVNDLDIRITKGGTTFMPYRLTSITTNGTGDNIVDPYERVDVSGASGTYTITVTHKGSLSGGSQNFSLVVTGITDQAAICDATTPTGVNVSGVGSNSAIVQWNDVVGATYDLRYRQTGASTWNVQATSGVSSTINGLTSETTYETQVRSKCADGTNSNYSSSINFTTTGVQINYCASKGNNVNDEYIGRVQIESINNPSGSGNGYSDFTNINTNLNKNSSVSITVTPTWTGTVYAEGYAVWIDYNQNGNFTDSGEQVWSQTVTTNPTVTGSFTVPTSALNGSTRMRVSMKYNGIPTSCETFTYGEVEDYTINIGGAAPDTQAPTAPTSLVTSNVAQTSLSLSWNASTDNVGVTGYDVFQGNTNIGTVIGTSTNITGLTPATAYSFRVRAHDAAGNNSGFSNTVNVTTLSNAVTYCASKGNNSNYEWIDLVRLNNLNNPSGNDGGYKDNTNLSANLPYGSNTIQISAGFSGSSYNEYWRIWIDFNKNGIFDSNELMVSGSSSSSATLSATFNVPTSALAGPTRMRVSMKYNASQSACEAFTYGEVEDYTVIVGNSAAPLVVTGGSSVLTSEMTLYPNPAKYTLNIALQDATGKDYVIYNVMGQVVGSGIFTETLDVSSLQSGIYMLEVNTEASKIMKRFVKE